MGGNISYYNHDEIIDYYGINGWIIINMIINILSEIKKKSKINVLIIFNYILDYILIIY